MFARTSLFAAFLAGAALAVAGASLPASASTPAAECTATKGGSNPKILATQTQELIQAHMAAGRTHIETAPATLGSFSAVVVCAW